MIGALALICRHPLKAHGREELASVRLFEGQALPHDRIWAVAHEAARLDPNGGWVRCINFARAAKAPKLMALTSRFDPATGHLTLRHPDQGEFGFHLGNEAEMAAAVDWLRPLNPPDRAQPTQIVRASQPLTDSAWPSISLCSLSSLRDLGARMGQDLSPHRFRGNLWIEGTAPWAEREWVGREIRIGSARALVREQITRCTATTSNPDTGMVDADTLSALNSGWGHQEFGLYIEVLEGAEIHLGDKVSL